MNRDISFCGFYMLGVIIFSQYTLLFLRLVLNVSLALHNEALRPIAAAVGLQFISYICLRGGERCATCATNEKLKWALVLPIYLGISLMQLAPYFEGCMLLQSSDSTIALFRLFLIHQGADFFKNSGLGSFTGYLLKLIAGLDVLYIYICTQYKYIYICIYLYIHNLICLFNIGCLCNCREI